MNSIKNIIAAFVMVATLSVSAAFAGDGIIVGDRSGDGIIVGDRSANSSATACPNDGIIVGDFAKTFTGILITGFTGILVSDLANSTTPCGIIVGD